MSEPQELEAALIAAAIAGAHPILEIYAGDFDVRRKDDHSPVTEADESAERDILRVLRERLPAITVIAEEAVAAGHAPREAGRFLLVDPLDGTKEFVSRNGEFTVNIALIEDGRAVAGVVLAPAKGRLFYGDRRGAFEMTIAPDAFRNRSIPAEAAPRRPIRARKGPPDGLVAVASRSHRDQKTEEYLSHYAIKDFITAGSSLKFCLVAAGEADIYPRHGPTMEWDTAAGQAVLEAAGGSVKDLQGAPMRYGKFADGLRNGFFVARGLE